MSWNKALSRGGYQTTFMGLQCSQSHGGWQYTGLILLLSVLGKPVIDGISFRFVFKTQLKALETKALKTLQLNCWPVPWGRIKKDPIFLLILFLYLSLQEMHLLRVRRQALGQSGCAVVGRCRRQKVRQDLPEDTHGLEPACRAERVHRVKGQKLNIK